MPWPATQSLASDASKLLRTAERQRYEQEFERYALQVLSYYLKLEAVNLGVQACATCAEAGTYQKNHRIPREFKESPR